MRAKILFIIMLFLQQGEFMFSKSTTTNHIELSQYSKNEAILNIADSIVIAVTNIVFFDILEREVIPYVPTLTKMSENNDSLQCSDDTNMEEYQQIAYTIRYRCKKSWWLNNKIHNSLIVLDFDNMSTIGSILVKLDGNMKLIDSEELIQNTKKHLQAFIQFNLRNFLLVEEARKIAKKHCTNGMKSPHGDAGFIYDSVNDVFYWRINKYKGFRKITVETFYINAETSQLIDKQSRYMRRTLWSALFKRFDLYPGIP